MPQENQFRPRVVGSVTLHRRYRGLLAEDSAGNRVMIVWQPHGYNFLWHLGEQCQCRVGQLQNLAIQENALLLGCNRCRRAQHYFGIGALASKRRVS